MVAFRPRSTLAKIGLVALVLLLVAGPAIQAVAAYNTPTEVVGSTHTTNTDFSNADRLDNLNVQNGKVVLGEGSTTEFEGFEDGDVNGWNLYSGATGSIAAYSGQGPYEGSHHMEYYPSSSTTKNIVYYDKFGTDGETGVMSMRLNFKANTYDNTAKPHTGLVFIDSETGNFYELRLVEANNPGRGFALYESTDQGASLDYLAGIDGTYYDDAYITVEMHYDYSSNYLRGEIYKLGGTEPFAVIDVNPDTRLNPDLFGVAGNGEGSILHYYDSITMESGTPNYATYQSQDHEIENPTNASVSIDTLEGGEATLKVIDGQGNVLGSKTVTSAGTHYISADPSQQADTTAKVRVEVDDTGTKGDLDFAMSEEAVYFTNDPPETPPETSPDGETVYTNTPVLESYVSDDQFNTLQGDSVIAEWYVDGSKVAETGPYTSDQSISYETTAELAEGSHEWYVRLVDDYGGEGKGDLNGNVGTFTVDHKAPIIHEDTASPSGGETTPYSSETLSIDVSDYDFAHDGDSLTVGWYVDGTLVHEDTGISSNGTVSYTTAELGEGDHNWYVKVGDSWGDTVTSDTFTYTISHVAPDVSNPSIDGTTVYETNTLAVDVDDDDFNADGDTVTVGFYVDGAKVNEQTISSAQRVSYDAGPYADGSHTWHVEAADSYGYKTVTQNYTLNIQHDKPAVTNPSLDGTTHYETNTLSVDVSDYDFPQDGDTVDVGIYVDGALVHEETISSNQTVSYDAGPYADGSYTWHAEAVDDYGHKTVTQDYTLNIQHDKPNVGNPSIDGLTHYENNTLAVDVSDYDFQFDGDTVDVGFYVDGGLVHSETIQSNQTVSFDAGPYADGSYTWHVEATDDYGYKTVTPDYTLNIQHFDPQPDNASASPQGNPTTHYEKNTLSIDVSDGDFAFDGDTVDVGWYVDGTLVAIQEVESNTTVSYVHSPLADGQHNWSVELVGDYGDSQWSDTFNFTIQHASPEFDNSTLAPRGVLDTQEPTFTVDLSDADFPRDADTVDVGLYVNESIEDSPELEAIGTYYSNATVELTPNTPVSGNATWSFKAFDDYGYVQQSETRDVIAPNSLYIHEESDPYTRVRDEVTLSIVSGSNGTVDRSVTSDGTVEFGQLPAQEDYVFSLTAEKHYPRGVYVDDLYARGVIFMLNSSEPAYETTLNFKDRTGNFQDNPVISIQTVINTSKVEPMPNNGPQWVTIGGDRLGVTGRYTTALRDGGRYRFKIESQTGLVRTLGFYTAKEPATVDLEVGEVTYPEYESQAYTWKASLNETESGGAVTFAYKDPTGNTTKVNVTVKDRDTGAIYGGETYRGRSLKEVVYTLPVNQSVYENRDMVVVWDAHRLGTQVDGSQVVGTIETTRGLPIDDKWLTVVYAGIVLLFAFAGGAYMGVPYVFMSLGGFGFIAVIIGIAPTAVGGGLSVLLFALGAFVQRKKTAQPQ